MVSGVFCSNMADSCRKGTLATILSPTKELALQTLKVATDLSRMVPSIVCGAVAGERLQKYANVRALLIRNKDAPRGSWP